MHECFLLRSVHGVVEPYYTRYFNRDRIGLIFGLTPLMNLGIVLYISSLEIQLQFWSFACSQVLQMESGQVVH